MQLSFFDQPIHPASTPPNPASDDYRITNHFWSPDILNGGIHRATDIGNFRMGYPLLTPASCEVMGLHHFDGALGIRMADQDGGFWSFWHLGTLYVPLNTWTPIEGVKTVALTGNTGARLPDGSPMPAHTHIEYVKDGQKLDPEPYLLGADYPWEGEEMQIKSPIVTQEWITKAGPESTFTRADGSTGYFTEATQVKAIASVLLPGGVNGRILDFGPDHEALTIPVSGLAEPVRGTRIIGSPDVTELQRKIAAKDAHIARYPK